MRHIIVSAFVVLGALALPAASLRAETDQTISAFSVWESQAATMLVGESEDVFTGTLIGRFYVNTDKGPVQAGVLSCPTTLHVKREGATQSGEAVCAISAGDGAQVFASLSCAGVYMVGCSGKATITGGTGRFKGITGDGSFTIRSDLANENGTGKAVTGAPIGTIGGILFFKELHYKLP